MHTLLLRKHSSDRRKMVGATLAVAACGLFGATGAEAAPAPSIESFECTNVCPSAGGVVSGSKVKVRGRYLGEVTTIVFHGRAGGGDDTSVGVVPASDTTIRLTVPPEARTGPISAWVGPGAHSRPTGTLTVREASAPSPKPERSTPADAPPRAESAPESNSAAPQIETSTSAEKLFFGQRRGLVFTYRVKYHEPVSVRIDLVRLSSRKVVKTWSPPPVAPDTDQSVRWGGGARREMAPEGRYAFGITAVAKDGLKTSNSAPTTKSPDAFSLFGHIFPIRGKHDYGNSVSRFGAGRAGHSHQGQDVFAACDTQLVAARGGVVKYSQYNSAAGNYIVIDGDGTGTDYAYMHMIRPSPLRAGQRVSTGQPIGAVGQTGSATGCHLHFEMWSAPGWYDGGRPFDPLSSLRSWDATS